MKPSLFVLWTSSVLTAVYGYTALSKLLDYTRFRAVLSASPLIAKGAGPLALAVIAAELAVALLLIFPRTRLWGLLGSLVLLVLFTSYLGYMVLYTPHLPCSCGGVISSFSWKTHGWFSLALLGGTTAALHRESKGFKEPRSVST